jgi:TolB-like protein
LASIDVRNLRKCGTKDFQARRFFALDLPVICLRTGSRPKMLLKFDNFELDTDRRELRGVAGTIHVEPQVFDLLLYFAGNANRVIGKDELIEHVWKGRIVSDAALNSRINSARRAIGESGERQALIRTVPRHGFLFAGDVTIQTSEPRVASGVVVQPSAATSLKLPDKPSITVLPFQNLSGDPQQDYFADGIVEEIITALSRFRQLFVIARDSSFTYKGRAVDIKQIARELGVRYVLEGSMRKSADRVRITGQLIDASTGTHLWADSFDGALEDIIDLQDQLTKSVVGAIAPRLEQAEIERAKHKPTERLDAYDYFLRGMASFYQRKREAISEALRLFDKAIELDPDFASAYGMAAWCYGWRKINRWMTDRVQETTEASRLARRAVELGQDDAVALTRAAQALGYVVGDVNTAVIFIDRALVLNPNLAVAWYASGYLRVFLGEPEVAIEHFAHAMRLSPLDVQLFAMQAGTALAHFLAGRYDEASSWAERALWEQANYVSTVRIAAASNALAGRLEEAQKFARRLRELDPMLRISNLKDYFPLQRSEDLTRYQDGLRKAGLPE